MSGPDAAAYLGLTGAAFSKWVAEGRIPKPLPGTRRWDRKAIDLALDRISGIATWAVVSETEDEFEKWEREYEARKATKAKR
jgi:hypothetical protein